MLNQQKHLRYIIPRQYSNTTKLQYSKAKNIPTLYNEGRYILEMEIPSNYKSRSCLVLTGWK
jgi:ubiquitin-protein ligase